MHSVLFDHHLEREGLGSQCEAVEECFDIHAQRCEEEFSLLQMAFMRIMCLSSVLHGAASTISSVRTRGIMQLLFLRLWPMSSLEKEVALHVNSSLLHLGLRARFGIFMRVAVNTSIMELASWLSFLLYAHTMISDGAVSSTWTGVYVMPFPQCLFVTSCTDTKRCCAIPITLHGTSPVDQTRDSSENCCIS